MPSTALGAKVLSESPTAFMAAFIVFCESSESYMVKEEENPSLSYSRRSILAQAEWKVEAFTCEPTWFPRAAQSLSLSSLAALLVKVMASSFQGRTCPLPMIRASLCTVSSSWVPS